MSANTYPGLYRGIVVNNRDPERLYRVTLRVPQVLGEEVTDWALGCFPMGWPVIHRNHADSRWHETHGAPATPTTPPYPHGHMEGIVPGHDETTNWGKHNQEHGVFNKLQYPEFGTPWYPRWGYVEDWYAPSEEHYAYKPVPEIGNAVWVMFEAGQAEHPVWVGTWMVT